MTKARTRHDGWTSERQALFIAALRISRSITRAATAAGMSRKSAYALRNRPSAAAFANAWDRALRQGDEGYTSLSAALRSGTVKVTRPALAKVTMVNRPGESAHKVKPSQLHSANLAAGARLP